MKITRRQLRKLIKESLDSFDIADRVTGTTLNIEQLFNREIQHLLARAKHSAVKGAKGEVQAKHITDVIDAIATTASFANESLEDADLMAFELVKMTLVDLSGNQRKYSRQITQAKKWKELGSILKHVLRTSDGGSYRDMEGRDRSAPKWDMSNVLSHDLHLKMWHIGKKIEASHQPQQSQQPQPETEQS